MQIRRVKCVPTTLNKLVHNSGQDIGVELVLVIQDSQYTYYFKISMEILSVWPISRQQNYSELKLVVIRLYLKVLVMLWCRQILTVCHIQSYSKLHYFSHKEQIIFPAIMFVKCNNTVTTSSYG